MAVIVTSPPQSNLTITALDFVSTAADNSIEVVGVFFYQDGVLNAAKYLSLPNDEYQTTAKWCELAQQKKIPLHLCATAAEKRGLIIEGGSDHELINENFIISGLGELVELTNKADRVVQL